MDLIAYLRILRRRWTVVFIPPLAAMLMGWLTLPEQEAVGPVAQTYSATATIALTGTSATTTGSTPQATVNLPTVGLFASIGEVPSRAARRLGFEGEPQVLASMVTVTPVSETGTLTLSSTDPDPEAAAQRVNAFAEATVNYFRDRSDEEASDRIQALDRLVADTTQALRDVQRQLSRQPEDPVLQARLEALQSQYSLQFGELQSLNQRLGGGGPLEVLQKGVAIPQGGGGFAAPTNPVSRIGLAGVAGLLLGVALALILERVDQRLRTRPQVEEAFGLPVLAEIPNDPIAQRRDRAVASMDRPASAVAEAYRSLRSVLLLHESSTSTERRSSSKARPALVVLTTSALSGEGKTTTVANLAAVMAESGRTVVALSMDLRDPRLHEHFDLPNHTGIADLLAADRGDHVEEILRETAIPGVRVATSGQRLDHPGALLASVRTMLEQARKLADVVLIDAPPALTVSDAADIAQYVDAVLVVARLNKSTTVHAAAIQRLLSRLHVPAIGTVLIGSTPTAPYVHRMNAIAAGSTANSAEASETA